MNSNLEKVDEPSTGLAPKAKEDFFWGKIIAEGTAKELFGDERIRKVYLGL